MRAPSDWARHQTCSAPDTLALDVVDGRDWSFAALDAQVDALATALSKRAEPPGQPLAARLANAESLALLALAAPRAGQPLLPINPALPPERQNSLLIAAGVEHPLDTLPAADPSATARPGLRPDDIQLIVATSGSTGTPKGAMLTGANLAAAVQGSRRMIPLERGDVWLGCLPMVHIGGLSTLLRCLEAGATLRLHSRFDVERVSTDIESGRVSHVSLVPAMLGLLLDHGCRPASRLRCALIGGAGLPAALADRALAAGWPLMPSYGMSEAGSQVATCVNATEWSPGLAGTPLPGVEIGFSAAGRVKVRGPMLMAGYLNPELHLGVGLTAEGWFETNDLGTFDDRGRLVIKGRADDMLISGGENVHPAEIEALAGRCPGLRAIAITGRPDPIWGDLIVAILVGETGPETFLDWCRTHVPSHLRPRHAVNVSVLPLNSIGKPDRKALREIALRA
ncbi:class I adenylate-forming enzyme family protein [Magnetospirillum molischianum]|uniref:AMP-dependent synthetase and ligase n=1 Tax=Magnetospirillum molischianum DSM 120 TaxID=1150626 RepID=H8FXS4_MAGML|nr:AMP-binding protein [Magnetospirillum molischianum]CCG43162.1 AMP-dependent synthetase and ligase [Magnetospirillum molischianum DSM 120]